MDFAKRWEPWTREDVEFLRKNYRKMTLKELGKKLDRTPESVQMKAARLGICRDYKQWTPKEKKKLRELFRSGNCTYREIADELGRSYKAVTAYIYRHDMWAEDETA